MRGREGRRSAGRDSENGVHGVRSVFGALPAEGYLAGKQTEGEESGDRAGAGRIPFLFLRLPLDFFSLSLSRQPLLR
jgi:hypothetical protein